MKFCLLCFAFILTSCAAYQTYNQTTSSWVKLKGGVYHNESWSDSMRFKRMSWYHGMTLYFDTLIYEPSAETPFAKWFSSQEKEYFTKCERFLVTASYSADPAKISHVNFREQMRLNGYDDVVIPNFAAYLRNHPDAADWRVNNYRVLGFCKRAPTQLKTSKLSINFPGFSDLDVRL